MAKSKSVDNTRVKTTGAPVFLTAGPARIETKMVSVRIDTALLDRFQAASKRAAENGYSMGMTQVMHRALEMAVQEADALEAVQPDLSLSSIAA